MPSTLSEISSCPILNRAFWSDHARMYLANYRQHKAMLSPLWAPEYKRQFRECMQYRREQKYFSCEAK